MTEKTATESLAEIRKGIRDLKRDELSARLKLSKEEWQRDYALIKGRTLRGYKDVQVDFEIEAEDLEYLGYHHEKDCSVRTYDEDGELIQSDFAEDRRALLDWHDRAHGLSLWANCPHDPCQILTDEFRRTP